MGLVDLLRKAVALGGSDIFIVPGSGVMVKVNSSMQQLSEGRLLPADTEELVRSMYDLANRDFDHLERDGDDDFPLPFRMSADSAAMPTNSAAR